MFTFRANRPFSIELRQKHHEREKTIARERGTYLEREREREREREGGRERGREKERELERERARERDIMSEREQVPEAPIIISVVN